MSCNNQTLNHNLSHPKEIFRLIKIKCNNYKMKTQGYRLKTKRNKRKSWMIKITKLARLKYKNNRSMTKSNVSRRVHKTLMKLHKDVLHKIIYKRN